MGSKRTPEQKCKEKCIKWEKWKTLSVFVERGSLNLVVMNSTRFFIPVSSKSRLSEVTTSINRVNKRFFLIFMIQGIVIFDWELHIHTTRFTSDENWWLPILVTSKIKALLQTQGTSTLFHNFSYRFVWFCFSSQWRYYCHILHELLATSSYWWPPKSRLTSNTGNINIISQFLLQICLILFQFTMTLLLSYTTWTFGNSSY